MSRYVEVEYEDFLRETDAAGLFVIDGEEVWIPWSQVEDGQTFDRGIEGTVSLTRWIAEQKEFDFGDD